MVGAAVTLLDDVSRVLDPAERLRRVRVIQDEVSGLDRALRSVKRETILELRALDPRPTWAEIGELLGVSQQRAEQLSRT